MTVHRHRISVVLSFCLVLFLAAPVLGQEVVEPTDEQVSLNDEALEAMNSENYIRAAALLEESNHLGELNVTYLNLGRSYQKLGRCSDATAALEAVSDAPKVESPPADLVEKKARQYLEEVRESCAQPAPSPSEDDPATAEPTPPAEPRPGDVEERDSTVPIVLTSVGTGLVLGAVALEFAALGLRRDVRDADADGDGFSDEMTRREALENDRRADTFDTMALSGAIVGGALLGTGIYLLLRSPERQSTVVLSPSPSSISISWSLRF